MQTKRQAFTLVELLVVIGIIGVLAAILLPAVNSAVNSARKNTCQNNMVQWGKGLINHATSKDFFPGYINRLKTNSGHDVPVSWMVKTLPYIEGNTISDQLPQALATPGVGPQQAIQKVAELFSTSIPSSFTPSGVDDPRALLVDIPSATCPSDPNEFSLSGRSSFVLSSGIAEREYEHFEPKGYVARFDRRSNGIGQNLFDRQDKVDISYVSSNDGTSNTLLLSENVNAITWYSIDQLTNGFVWAPWVTDEAVNPSHSAIYAINVGEQQVFDNNIFELSAAALLNEDLNAYEQLTRYSRPSSNHSGGVNVFFADGHASFLSDEIDWTVYVRLMTPASQKARHAHPFTEMNLTAEQINKLRLPVSENEMNP